MDRRQFVQGIAAGAAITALPAFAAEPERLAVTIRSREVTGPLPHIWEECVGSDRAAITLRDSGRRDIKRAQADCFQLYKTAAVAVKSVHPSLQVGGPATASTECLPEFPAFCGA